MHRSIAAYAEQGWDLVVDGILPYRRPADRNDALTVLDSYRLYLIGVHCNENVLKRRETQRYGYHKGWAIEQYKDLHHGINYDIEIDNSSSDSVKNVDQVVQALYKVDSTLSKAR